MLPTIFTVYYNNNNNKPTNSWLLNLVFYVHICIIIKKQCTSTVGNLSNLYMWPRLKIYFFSVILMVGNFTFFQMKMGPNSNGALFLR